MMEADQSRAAVLRLFEAFGSRDAARIGDCLADDVVWVAPRGNATAVAIGAKPADDAGVPDGSNHLGKAAILAFMSGDFGRLFGSVSNQLTLLLADGAHVVAELRMSAALPNGRSYVNDYCFVYRVADGKVAEIREYMGTRGGWVQMFGDGPGGALI